MKDEVSMPEVKKRVETLEALQYKGKRIMPVFASLYMGDNIVSYLTKNKIYAMAIKEIYLTLKSCSK